MAQGRDAAGTLDVTHGVIWRQLMALCVPIFISSFCQQAYNLINTFVVGRFGGALALGAIQSTMVLGDLCIGFSLGVGSGCAVITGQFFGAGDERHLCQAVHTAMALSLVMGLLFSVVGITCIEGLLAFLSTPAALMGEASVYGRFYFGGLLFMLVYNMGAGVLRAVGDARTPSRIVMATCAVNIAFDLLLVAWLRLDALGCGIATAISSALSAVLVFARLMRVDAGWRLDVRRLRIVPEIAWPMLKTGLPLGIQSSIYSVSNLIVQSTVNSFGASAVAGWGLSRRIDGITWLCSDALGVAVTTFAAQNYGARNYERMRRGLRTSLAITTIVIGGISAVIFLSVEVLAGVFISDPEVIKDASLMLRFIAPLAVAYSLSDNVAGVIRGTGESLRPMLLTVVGTCVFRVIWLLTVVPVHHTLPMVMMSYPVTWTLTGILFVIYYRWGGWLRRA